MGRFIIYCLLLILLHYITVFAAPVTSSLDISVLQALFTSTGGGKWNYNAAKQCLSSSPDTPYVGREWDFTTDASGNYVKDPCPQGGGVAQQPFIGIDCTCDTVTCRVSKLTLPCGNLKGTIPNMIGNLSSLVSLHIGSNSLTGTLPASLGRLAKLRSLRLHQNSLTGTMPDQFSLLAKLQILSLYNNQLGSTLPAGLRHLSDLRSLMIQQNNFTNTGNAFSFLNKTWQSHLRILDVSNNRFTGKIPNSLFEFPELEVCAIGSNCFSGALPGNICEATKLNTLYVSAATSGLSCRSYYFNQDTLFHTILGFDAFAADHFLTGSLPTCIYTMPNMKTFHAAANKFLGEIPKTVSDGLFDLDLSRNRLIGTISPELAAAAADHNLTKLRMAYNRINGSLDVFKGSSGKYFSKPLKDSGGEVNIGALDLKVNRLSGTIPESLLFIKNVSILTGNLFTCGISRSELPANANTRNSYQCGATNMNYMLFAFAGITFIIAVVWQLTKRNSALGGYHLKLTLWMAVVSGRVDFDDNFIKIEQIRRYSNSIRNLRVFALMLSVPVVLVLGMYFYLTGPEVRMLEHIYSWASTAAYLTGDRASICLSIAGGSMIVISLSLIERNAVRESITYIGHEEKHGPDQLEEEKESCIKWLVLPILRMLFLALFIWGIAILGTLIYLYSLNPYADHSHVGDSHVEDIPFLSIINHDSVLEQQVVKLIFAAFLLFWVMIATPFLFRSTYLSFGVKKKYHDALVKCLFGTEVKMIFIFTTISNFWVPMLTALINQDACFRNVFIAPKPVTTHFNYQTCTDFDANGSCGDYSTYRVNTSINVPFVYNYTCTVEMLRLYVPLYLQMYLFLMIRCGFQFVYIVSDINHGNDPYVHYNDKSCWRKIKSKVASIVQLIMPNYHLLYTSSQRKFFYTEGVVFGHLSREWITENIAFYLGDILILLTVGVVAPAVAAVIIAYLVCDTYLSHFVLGRFLVTQMGIVYEHRRLNDPHWTSEMTGNRPDDPLFLSPERRDHLQVDIEDVTKPYGAIAVLKEMEFQCRYMPASFLSIGRTAFVIVPSMTTAFLMHDVLSSRISNRAIQWWPSIFMVASAVGLEICTCCFNQLFLTRNKNDGTDDDDVGNGLSMIEMAPQSHRRAATGDTTEPHVPSPIHIPAPATQKQSTIDPLPPSLPPGSMVDRNRMPKDRPRSVSVRRNFEQQLYQIYATYNKDKIVDVPVIAANFKGREIILLDALRVKYYDADRKSRDLSHANLFMDLEEPSPSLEDTIPAGGGFNEKGQEEEEETWEERSARVRRAKKLASKNANSTAAAQNNPAQSPGAFNTSISIKTSTPVTSNRRKTLTPKARNAPILSMDDVIPTGDAEETLYDEDGVKIPPKKKVSSAAATPKAVPVNQPVERGDFVLGGGGPSERWVPPPPDIDAVTRIVSGSRGFNQLLDQIQKKESAQGIRTSFSSPAGAAPVVNPVVSNAASGQALSPVDAVSRVSLSNPWKDDSDEDEDEDLDMEFIQTPARGSTPAVRWSSSGKKRPPSTPTVVMPDAMEDFA